MKALADIADLLQRARKRVRDGGLSREPFLLLRVGGRGDSVECDWMMRSVDPWDKYLPEHLATENQTLQSLRDALKLREIVFRSFPAVGMAHLRMFRADAEHQLELVMTGSVNRTDEVLHRVPSVMMRARLCGFHFNVREGSLRGMVPLSLGCS
jgi:hypothetical protein